MEGIYTLWEIVVHNDWIAKLDLKDAYVLHKHWKFLLFWCAKFGISLPFGLSCTPWVFTKVLKSITAFLRGLGVCLIVYIDDMLNC